ncbi:hypothetical protein ACFLX8_03530 [Chloroflexota bacterium]
MIKIKRDKPIIAISLAVFFMGILVMTNPLTTAAMAMTLFILWFGFFIYNRINQEKVKSWIGLILPGLYSIGAITWWMYVSGHFRMLVRMIRYGFGSGFWGSTEIPQIIVEYQNNIPTVQRLFNAIGIPVFYCFVILGLLYVMNKKFGNRYSFTIALVAISPVVLTTMLDLIGGSIISTRWWYLSQILSVPLLAIGFLLLCSIFKRNLTKGLLLAVLTFILSGLMILGPSGNTDNRTFTPDTKVRYGFTESELQAESTLSTLWDKDIVADWQYCRLGIRPQPTRMEPIGETLATQDFTHLRDKLIIIREEITQYPFNNSESYWVVNYDPYQVLSEQKFSCIYNNGSVSAFQAKE